MKTRLMLLLYAIVSLLLSATLEPAHAQAPIPPLPADLLFTASLTAGQGDLPRDVIVRVDAETLEVSPFYVDDEAFEILPLSWSPQGDLLAIYRRMPPLDEAYTQFPRQLCILTRNGVFQRCMNDSPPMHWGGLPQYWMVDFPIAWGPNGETVFYVTEYPNEKSSFGYGRRLVEASVLTGETLRVVYDYPDPWPVSPSPDLNHAEVGFGGLWEGSGDVAFILDLNTGTQLNASDLVPDNTWLSFTCRPFSPGGQYATVSVGYNLASYAPEMEPPDNDYFEESASLLVLLDTQGTIRHIVGGPEGSPAAMWYQDCPGWQSDEQAIVFLAYAPEDRRIMRYSLVDQVTTTLYKMGYGTGREAYVNPPLIPSLEGTHIALTVSDGPYEDPMVAVLFPNGEIYRIPSPYRFGLYPLWVPPLTADEP